MKICFSFKGEPYCDILNSCGATFLNNKSWTKGLSPNFTLSAILNLCY